MLGFLHHNNIYIYIPSLCNSGWPGICYVNQAVLHPPGCVSQSCSVTNLFLSGVSKLWCLWNYAPHYIVNRSRAVTVNQWQWWVWMTEKWGLWLAGLLEMEQRLLSPFLPDPPMQNLDFDEHYLNWSFRETLCEATKTSVCCPNWPLH